MDPKKKNRWSILHHIQHLNTTSFEKLVELLAPSLLKKDTVMRECITPEEMCCVALRYFASGESFRSLDYQFQINRKAISYIVEQVPAAIIKILGETYLEKPNTAEESVKILRKFKERWNFPNGLGGVDGKHTVLQQPKSSVSHQSRLKNSLEKNTLNLPDLTPLPDRNYRLPYACTRDDAFPLTAYMMKPYPQKTCIILQIRVVFPRNENAQELIFKQ